MEPIYPIVCLDALRVKIRGAESRMVKNKAVYVALGVTDEGECEVLGLWIAANEGAKFWLSIMNNTKGSHPVFLPSRQRCEKSFTPRMNGQDFFAASCYWFFARAASWRSVARIDWKRHRAAHESPCRFEASAHPPGRLKRRFSPYESF